jgi:hypothetical protein
MIRKLLPIIVLALIVVSCSDDDGAQDIQHYYNPVWSQDGSIIVAAFESAFADPNAPRGPVERMAVLHVATNSETIIPITPGLDHFRYHITPDNNAIAVASDKLDFYSFSGEFLANYTVSSIGLSPVAITFSTSQKSFLWVAYDNGTAYIGRTTYSGNPWQADLETTFTSFFASSKPIDIKATDQGSLILALDEGMILEYSFAGTLLSEYDIDPFPSSNPWRKRIEFLFNIRTGLSYVYTLNAQGLLRINLSQKKEELIVNGLGQYLVGFDASDSTDGLIYEVSSGDIYRGTLDGVPLFRIGPSHRMAKFSSDGKDYSAVARVSGAVDTLTIKSVF